MKQPPYQKENTNRTQCHKRTNVTDKLSVARATNTLSSRRDGSPDFSKLGQCKSCKGFNIPGAATCRHCGAKMA